MPGGVAGAQSIMIAPYADATGLGLRLSENLMAGQSMIESAIVASPIPACQTVTNGCTSILAGTVRN